MIRIWLIICLAGMFIGCARENKISLTDRSTDFQMVVNKVWQWEGTNTPVEKVLVAHPDRYTILFADEGRLEARFDCNRGGGSYKVEKGTLFLGPFMSTRMACPEDSQDGPFMRDLERVRSFHVEDGVLFLEFPENGGAMRFSQSP